MPRSAGVALARSDSPAGPERSAYVGAAYILAPFFHELQQRNPFASRHVAFRFVATPTTGDQVFARPASTAADWCFVVNREVFRVQEGPSARAFLFPEPVGQDLSQLLERVRERPVFANRLVAVDGISPLRQRRPFFRRILPALSVQFVGVFKSAIGLLREVERRGQASA